MQFPRARSRSPPRAAESHSSATASTAPWLRWGPLGPNRTANTPRPEQSNTRGIEFGLPALRRDAPERRPWARGAAPDLQESELRDQAVRDLEAGFYAASSAASVRSRRRCYAGILSQWGLRPFPADLARVKYIGAGLKSGKYRSYASVLAQFKVDSERNGDTWSAAMLRMQADAARSCRRGLGPSIQALPLPFERLHELPPDPRPWVSGGPVGPRNAIVCGSWWMARELELSTLRAGLLTIVVEPSPVASLELPASKSDVAALGVRRAHACICGGSRPRADCPVHSAWDQRLLLAKMFPSMHQEGAASMALPLFPTARGTAPTKRAMTETIVMAARLLGVPLSSADGMNRITGHTLRPTGAQGLAKMGLDMWSIELLGRWGSKAVQRYVRDATVSEAAARARAARMHVNLKDLIAQIKPEVRENRGQDFSAELVRETLARILPDFAKDWRESVLAELQDILARTLLQRGSGQEQGTSRATSASASSSSTSSSEPELGEVEVETEVAAAAPPAPIPAEISEPPAFISSSYPGRPERTRRHKIFRGPPIEPAGAWSTVCGWRYGMSGTAIESRIEHPMCARCARLMVS